MEDKCERWLGVGAVVFDSEGEVALPSIIRWLRTDFRPFPRSTVKNPKNHPALAPRFPTPNQVHSRQARLRLILGQSSGMDRVGR